MSSKAERQFNMTRLPWVRRLKTNLHLSLVEDGGDIEKGATTR